MNQKTAKRLRKGAAKLRELHASEFSKETYYKEKKYPTRSVFYEDKNEKNPALKVKKFTFTPITKILGNCERLLYKQLKNNFNLAVKNSV